MLNRTSLMFESFTRFIDIIFHASKLSKIELLYRYKRSLLGIWWALLNPLISVCVYYIIFNEVIKIKDFSKSEYLIYLVCGVIVINFNLQTITSIAENFSSRVNVITRIKVNPYTLAQGTLGASVFNFLMTLIPLFILLLYYRESSPRLLLLIPLTCLMMFFVFGVGLALAVLYTLFDDMKAIMRIVFSFVPFLTPIFYKLDQLPLNLQGWIATSPFTVFLTLFRWCIGIPEKLTIAIFVNLSLGLAFSFVCMIFFHNKWNVVVKML